MLDPIYKLKLKQLRKDLKGHYREVAEGVKKSKSTVSRVLWGEWIDEEVFNKCVEVRDRIVKEKEDQFKRMTEKA